MPLQRHSLARPVWTVAASLLAAALVGTGGASAALPACGVAWLGWELLGRRTRWHRNFQPRARYLALEAAQATAHFGSVTAAGLLAGGEWGVGLMAAAFCALSVAMRALELDSPVAIWSVTALTWLGPALPQVPRVYSASSITVDEGIPVIVLSAIYVPLAVLLLARGRRS